MHPQRLSQLPEQTHDDIFHAQHTQTIRLFRSMALPGLLTAGVDSPRRSSGARPTNPIQLKAGRGAALAFRPVAALKARILPQTFALPPDKTAAARAPNMDLQGLSNPAGCPALFCMEPVHHGNKQCARNAGINMPVQDRTNRLCTTAHASSPARCNSGRLR